MGPVRAIAFLLWHAVAGLASLGSHTKHQQNQGNKREGPHGLEEAQKYNPSRGRLNFGG